MTDEPPISAQGSAEPPISCPKCLSTQIHAGRRGYSLVFGFWGANAVHLTCLRCGYRFAPGQSASGRQITPFGQTTPKPEPGAWRKERRKSI